ncbi:MAG: ABC transporter ATP-binding protein [Candidatus Tectomicrobia bacterium]|nr:ABC transporter ATP-binding protein [Candidatus Tectomicrobia bacterium]
MSNDKDLLLKVSNLKTYFFTREGVVKAIDGVDFELHRGEVLGIVGESGCGKSVTALSILRLVPNPPGRIVEGEVIFEGKDLLTLSDGEIREIRGNRISMIFQDPMTSLNPVFTIGDQIAEPIITHKKASSKGAFAKAIELLKVVKIPDAERRIGEYPHQFSGGMRQRAMIAMAFACQPALLIADEATTALDVTVQAQILKQIRQMKQEYGTAIIVISHDLSVIARLADRVAIMYAGKIVESGDVRTILKSPTHPYTEALLHSIPRPGSKGIALESIEGQPPHPAYLPPGCSFAPRCPLVVEQCHVEMPPLTLREEGHLVRCWKR